MYGVYCFDLRIGYFSYCFWGNGQCAACWQLIHRLDLCRLILWCLYWILKLIYICNNIINGCGIPSKLYGWSILRLSSLLIRKNAHPKRLHCLHFPLAITYRLTTKTILIIIDALNLALNYYIIIFPHKTRNPISFGINVCRGFVSNISFK